jgi:hypothetical protein
MGSIAGQKKEGTTQTVCNLHTTNPPTHQQCLAKEKEGVGRRGRRRLRAARPRQGSNFRSAASTAT